MSDPDQYTVGWICALQTEYVAARAFLEQKHPPPETLSPNDNNHYTLGEIRGHQIAIAVLPDGGYGTSLAACVARDMLHSFPNIRFGLMVGIGGGVPTKQDIRLGDIVVSSPQNGRGGLVQYDFGKELQGQDFRQTGFLNQPPPILRTAVSGLKTQYEEEGHQLKEDVQNAVERLARKSRQKYTKPSTGSDRLHKSQYTHADLDGKGSCIVLCNHSELIIRPERGADDDDPAIYYGLIASGNRVIKDAIFRDKLATEQNILCFEMEAAGLMNQFPCLVIRGICDYADSHKSNEWQGYAAMTAAAYAKDLLRQMIPHRVRSEQKATDIMRGIQLQLDGVAQEVQQAHTIINTAACDIGSIAKDIDLEKLPVAEGAEFGAYTDRYEECLPGTRTELRRQINEWANSSHSKCIFWLNGAARTGKSTISRTVARSFQEEKKLGGSFFFKRGEGDCGTAIRLFSTIARQLLARIPELLPSIREVIKEDPGIAAKSLKEQFEMLILHLLKHLTGLGDSRNSPERPG